MLRCPKCLRFGIAYNGIYECLWKGCGWKSFEYKEPKVKLRFKKFIKAVK